MLFMELEKLSSVHNTMYCLHIDTWYNAKQRLRDFFLSFALHSCTWSQKIEYFCVSQAWCNATQCLMWYSGLRLHFILHSLLISAGKHYVESSVWLGEASWTSWRSKVGCSWRVLGCNSCSLLCSETPKCSESTDFGRHFYPEEVYYRIAGKFQRRKLLHNGCGMPKISWRKLSWVAVKLRNSWRFSPLKVSAIRYIQLKLLVTSC